MNGPDCQRYLEDPEGHAGHLAECADCRAVAAGLEDGTTLPALKVDPDALPLAPWEGASHRSWPLVAGGALTVVTLAIACGLMSGVSPMHVVDAGMLSVDGWRGLIFAAATALRSASSAWQVGFGVLFIAVNALLFVLLRRAPRSFDV